MKKELLHNLELNKAVRDEIRSYRMGLTSNPSENRSLIKEIRSIIKTEQEEIEVGTTEDYTRIKTEDWHIRVLHPRDTGRTTLITYRTPESITINSEPFFFEFDATDVNSMIESLVGNDKRFPATREVLDYEYTENPEREGEKGSSPTRLCLDTLSLRRLEAETPQA